MSGKYEVYTDGACSNNQAAGGQPGGWGVAFIDGRTYSGSNPSTTNNRMELTAVIEALKKTPRDSKVDIYSDSAYIINAFQQNWIENWIKRGWKTSQGKSVENQDLWKKLIPLAQERNVQWIKVKGHSGNKWNDMADRLAVEATEKMLKSEKNKESISIIEEENQESVLLRLTEKQFLLLLEVLQKISDENLSYKKLYQDLLAINKIKK